MYGIEEEIKKKTEKFYQSVWLISVIAIGVTAGNLISHSITSWNEERKLQLAMQEAEVKANADIKKMNDEFEALIKKHTPAPKINQTQNNYQLEQQAKDADCDYWIAQSRIEKSNESMAERLKACKTAGRSGY